MDNVIVSRFGGNAAANSQEVKNACEIVNSNPSRRYIIVSAPGATSSAIGMTDMLYICHSSAMNRENYEGVLGQITERFQEIVDGLGIDFNLKAEIDLLRKSLEMKADLDYIGSRGEYITAKIFAKFLGWTFVDASELIFFKSDSSLDKNKTFTAAKEKLKIYDHAVIPSFYGSMPNGKIKTFPRGDCDTAGAAIACSIHADLFEKWSESANIYSVDPSIISHTDIIRNITYGEVLEMNYIGLEVVKDSVVFMLNELEIPMKIFSMNNAGDPGMLISRKLPENISRSPVICIAGHNNFNVINIQKYGLNKNHEFEEKLFPHFSKRHIASRHYISGIHKILIVLKNPRFDLERENILREIDKSIHPDAITVKKGVSLIALIGEGIATTEGIFNKIFAALLSAKINVNIIDFGADNLNIILGVLDEDYEKAIKVLYEAVILK